MRPVVHDAPDADHPCTFGGGKRVNDGLGVRDRVGRWREHLIDDRHLRRVDGELADKPVTARILAFAPKAVAVAEIDVDCVDCWNSACGGAGQAQHSASR